MVKSVIIIIRIKICLLFIFFFFSHYRNMHSSPLPKRPPSSRLLHNLFKYCQSQYRYSPRRFIAITLAIILFLLFAFIFIFTDFAAFIFRRGPRVVVFDDGVVEIIPDDIEEGKPYTYLNPELKKISEYDDANPQINDFDELDEVLERKFSQDDDADENREEKSQKRSEKMKNEKKIIKTSNTNDRENSTKNHRHKKTQNHPHKFPLSKLKQTSTPDLIIIVALRNLELLSSNPRKPLIPYSLFVSLAAAGSTHQKQKETTEEEKQEATNIKFVFVLSSSASRVVQYDKEDFHEAMLDTIRQSPPKLFRGENENRVAHQFHRSSSDFVFDGLSLSTIHPSLHDIGSYEVIFSGNGKNVEEDLKEEEVASLSSLYQKGLESETVLSSRWMKMMNNQNTREDFHDSFFLFLSESVMPITPLNFIRNLYDDLLSHQHQQLAAVQCGLASHQQRNRKMTSSLHSPFKDTLQNRLLEFKNRASKISSSTSSDGHFQHSELNEKVLRQIFTADDEEDENENEHEHDKNDHKSSSSIIKVIDAGWNVGISANLHADYHTNTMVSMTGPNVGFSLHSSGFEFGSSSSSYSTANISSDENRNNNNNTNNNDDDHDNKNIELVDAFGSNCIMIKESALLKTISFFPIDNNNNNKNNKNGNKKYLIKGAFEPTSHHQFLSDVDLALAKNWLNSASHQLHLNQLALVDSLSHFFMLRHAVGVTATFRPEEDRDDDDRQNDNDQKTDAEINKETTTPTKKHLSDEEIANMLSMTLFDADNDKNKNENNLVKEVLKNQNRLKKEADDENNDDENKNNKKKHNKNKHGKKKKEKEFYELLANESELVMLCLSTKLNQDRTVEFDHVPNYFKSPEENKKRIQALERQHDDDDAEKSTRKSNKNAKSSGKKSFEEFSIYEKNQFDFDSDSYPIANYHEFFYEEVTDEVFSATSSRLNVDDWDRWNNKLNVREHQYDSELKSKFDRCDSFDSAFFNNNSYTIKKIQSLVERHRVNMTKIYQAAMCYCDLAVAQVLERRRLLKALHSNYHHHRSHHHHRKNSTTTNKNEIHENQQPKNEISSSSFTSLPLIPDASLGWSLSLRLRLLLKAENKRIFGVSKRSAAFFVLPFVDENSGNENEAVATATKHEQFNFIFSNFVFKPSFRLSAIERMFSPRTAAHHHHHLHSDSKIFEDSSTTHDENFFMNRNWQKFALSLFPEYRRVIEQHHHQQQRFLKQNPTNNDENENEKSTSAPAIVPDHHDDHVSHNNMLSSFLQNHLPPSFNSFLQKLHLTSKHQHLNSATTTTPFMKIHWHLADCCHCCGFSVEIAHLIRRLSEHYAVSLAQPAECYCQGLPAAFADTIGRSYQQDLKYFFSRLYPHEKILWVHHTPPPLFKNVPELGFGSRKPDRFIARSMYEFTRVGKDWVENVNIPDEWWAPSKFVKDLLVDDDLKVSPEKVFIIPESIATKYFDPDAILEEQKIRMLSTMSTTSQHENPPTTQTVEEDDENTHYQESRHENAPLDFSDEFNSRYGTDWKFVSCNRGPSPPSTKNKNKNKKLQRHHHHARGQNHQEHDNEDGDDDFAFLSQFKWEPRKGPTFLIEGFLRAFGSNTLKNELSMTMMTTKNETGTIVNRQVPQFIRRNQVLMKRIQQQEKKRDERNRFSHRDDREKEKEKAVEDIADQDVTLLILTGLYDLEHSPGLDLEAVNRHNVSNIIEIELVNYFRKKLFSSQAGATTRPHPLRFESDQVMNDFIKSQILTSPQHSPRFCLIGDSVTEKEMARIFRGADAFVLPTRGEGWGLPTMQAMSMGLPTISTNWGGSVDFTTKETSFLIDLDGLDEIPEWSPYLFLPGKKWSTPSISELTKLMQFVRSKKERSFVEEIGKRARRHIVNNFDDDEVWKVIDRRVKEIGRELVE